MAARKVRHPKRTFDARPDTVDFRDQMFIPSLVQVRARILPDEYIASYQPLILDQGNEGACTGFGLAAVCHHLLNIRKDAPLAQQVSPKMLYEMAKRYDEWEGEAYSGSSTRGAMKGWHKHGVCSGAAWTDKSRDKHLTSTRAEDATLRPLGAYFMVDHHNLIALHAALNEVGILYAAALVHEGWNRVESDGHIPFDNTLAGAHAFAIIGYDETGFWLQNSWGDKWGYKGFGRISYGDWLKHGRDVWVARCGVPIRLEQQIYDNAGVGRVSRATLSFNELRPHVVMLGNDGQLLERGTYSNTRKDIRDIFQEHLPRISAGWSKKRLVIYAHGGLTAEKPALERIENFVRSYTDQEMYFLGIIWRTDFMTTIRNILEDALSQRKPEGVFDKLKGFLSDRLDDALEPLARFLGGKTLWDEMKENGARATTRKTGGGSYLAEQIAEYAKANDLEVHLIGFSAGTILLSHFGQRLIDLKVKIKTLTYWAGACTIDLFKQTLMPAVNKGTIEKFTCFNLSGDTELDDSLYGIYNKSLLYLVAHAFEDSPRIPLTPNKGTPLLGMDKFVSRDAELSALFKAKNNSYVLAPNQEPPGHRNASKSKHHGDFDDDINTVQATIARILEK